MKVLSSDEVEFVLEDNGNIFIRTKTVHSSVERRRYHNSWSWEDNRAEGRPSGRKPNMPIRSHK